MTTFTNAFLNDGQLPNAQAAIFTATVTTLIKSFWLGNPSPVTQTILLWKSHNGGTARFWRRIQLRQYQTGDIVEGGQSIELDAGDAILAQASSAATVDYTLDGVTIT